MNIAVDTKKCLAIALVTILIPATLFVAPLLTVILVIVPLLIFCLPGISVMKWITFQRRPNPALELAAICVSGYFVSALLAIGLLFLFKIPTGFALLSPLIYFVIVASIRLFKRYNPKNAQSDRSKKINDLPTGDAPGPTISRFSRTDLWIVIILTLLTLVAALPPLINIGYEHPEGYYYRAYFNSDYLKHVAVTAHLAHSRIPPDNPYLKTNEPLHYYWFYYVFPASIRALGVPGVETIDILRVLTIWGIIVFCFFLYGLCRHFTEYRSAAFLAVFCGLFAHSYEALYYIRLLKQMSLPIWANMGRFNIDGMTRWFYGHPQLDCLYRSLIFTPQHLFALMLFGMSLLVVYDLYAAKSRPPTKNLWFLGLLTGLSFGFSSFISLAACMWVFLVIAFTGLVKKNIYIVIHVFSAFAISGLCFLALGIVGQSKEALVFLPQFRVIRKLPIVLCYNYGPLLLLLPLGLIRGFFKKYRLLAINLLTLLALCLFLILFVQIQNFPTDMGIKVGLVLSVVLVLFLTIGLSIRHRYLRVSIYLLAIPLIVPAILTVILDAHNSSEVTNVRYGSLVTTEDMQASKWIRDNLPANVRIQIDPFERSESFSLIPTFAERRTTAGDKMHARIFLSDVVLFDILDDAVGAVFKTQDPIITSCLMDELEIDYVMIGNIERELYPGVFETFNNFVTHYRHNRVSIHSNQLLAALGAPVLPVSHPAPGQTYHLTLPVTSHDPEKRHYFTVQLQLFDETTRKTVELSKTLIDLEPLATRIVPIEFFIPEEDTSFDTIQINLFHVMDQEDVFFCKAYSLVDGHNTFSTTGSVIFSGESGHVEALYPEHPAGILARIRPGVFPEGHYSLHLESTNACSNMTSGFLRVYSTAQTKPLAEASLSDNSAVSNKPKALDFYLPFSSNLYFDLGIEEGGCLSGSRLHLSWMSSDHCPFPLSQTKIPFMLAREDSATESLRSSP